MIKQEPIDKSEWIDGPWKQEPDRMEWEYLGFPCLIVRNTKVTGALCGYVAVPPGHPAFEKDYGNFDDIKVHGGLTYSDHCYGDICHKPKEGEPDNVWWLGFDCAHFGDGIPRLDTLTGISYGTYKDINYVRNEVEDLAKQLKEKADAQGN